MFFWKRHFKPLSHLTNKQWFLNVLKYPVNVRIPRIQIRSIHYSLIIYRPPSISLFSFFLSFFHLNLLLKKCTEFLLAWNLLVGSLGGFHVSCPSDLWISSELVGGARSMSHFLARIFPRHSPIQTCLDLNENLFCCLQCVKLLWWGPSWPSAGSGLPFILRSPSCCVESRPWGVRGRGCGSRDTAGTPLEGCQQEMIEPAPGRCPWGGQKSADSAVPAPPLLREVIAPLCASFHICLLSWSEQCIFIC